MANRAPTRPRRGGVAIAVVLAWTALVLVAAAGGALAAPYPALPIASDRGFLGNLTAPTLAPGAGGSISFTVGDPLAAPIDGTVLTLGVYAFNGFPGNATATGSVAGTPILSNASASSTVVSVAVGTVAPGGVYRASVGVATSGTTPSGAFAVRTALSFRSNGTAYQLESRGWFNATTWAAATQLPNGSATLNLSVLGVSGVTPETAIVVAASTFPTVLTAILVVAAIFVGAGAVVYFRRGPGSSSGAR